MNEVIRSLIEDLRRGRYEDPTERIGLLAAALREHAVGAAFLAELLKAPQIPLRLAAIEACLGRDEPELHQALVELSRDREARVRVKAAGTLGSLSADFATEALKKLGDDPDADVRIAAVEASAGNPALLDMQRSRLQSDSSWAVRRSAAVALDRQATPAVVPDLFAALAHDSDDEVQARCAEFLEKRLGHSTEATLKHLPTAVSVLMKAETSLSAQGERFPTLLRWIQQGTAVAVDLKALASYGIDLSAAVANGSLPRAYEVADPCRKLMDLVQREPRRSIVVLGEAGVGKSALVHELAWRLAAPANGGWRVLRVSPTDFMSGTRYLGEWETRVRELVDAVKKPRRTIVYVPQFSVLTAMGRWSKSDANIATALAPYIEDGSIVVLGECTPDEYERGFGAMPSVQRLFDRFLLAEAGEESTRRILAAIRDDAHAAIADDVLDRLLELSGYFLGHQRRPGNAAGLLRAVLAGRKESASPVTCREVLNVLSKATGLPADLVDDQVPLRSDTLRGFFEQRIMGQPEALEAVVDLVTLIKAGLTDPNKPFGVFLFVGPTGVGKTELARALAEFIFGDARRLLRLDMSEFASPEGYERLIGVRGEGGLLTEPVRQQPFSVLLLDEIEKSHVNVFDLCLQIFDAGRLTDGRGQFVDFRRTIIILTSNIGAEAPGAPVGFNTVSSQPSPDGNQERTWRELSHFFRPEFLNRLDRIVNFRPLSLEVAERIAQREVETVLKRSGIARRGLLVSVDPSALSLLVREGYSAHFGARPLKRTVERLLLLPLARAIACGRQLETAVVSLYAAVNKIEARITRPPAPAPATRSKPERPSPWRRRADELAGAFAVLQPGIQPLADRKSELVARTSESGFYRDEATRATTFDEIHRLDQFLSLVDAFRKGLDGLRALAEQRPSPEAEDPTLAERLTSLAAELAYISQVAKCRDARDLGDVLLAVSRVDRKGTALAGVEQIARMYVSYAGRRRLSPEILAERYDEHTDLAYVQVVGLGAFGLLKDEAGLHPLHRRFRRTDARDGREKAHEDRETVRVTAIPLGSDPDKRFLAALTTKFADLRPARSRLVTKANCAVSVFHQPSLRSLEVWTTGPRAAAPADKAVRILHAEVHAPDPEAAAAEIRRRYDLGIGSRIKDLRSGRTTARIAHVFKGHLELVSAKAGDQG